MTNTQDDHAALEAMLAEPADPQRMADLAIQLTAAAGLESRAKKLVAKSKAEIIALLDASGQNGADAGGRRLGFTTRTYYGVAEGENADARADNLDLLKAWLELTAPEVNLPASTNIGKAVAAYLDNNPGAEVPGFVAVTEKRSLTNRQA